MTEHRPPHGTGIVIGLIFSVVFWAALLALALWIWM